MKIWYETLKIQYETLKIQYKTLKIWYETLKIQYKDSIWNTEPLSCFKQYQTTLEAVVCYVRTKHKSCQLHGASKAACLFSPSFVLQGLKNVCRGTPAETVLSKSKAFFQTGTNEHSLLRGVWPGGAHSTENTVWASRSTTSSWVWMGLGCPAINTPGFVVAERRISTVGMPCASSTSSLPP